MNPAERLLRSAGAVEVTGPGTGSRRHRVYELNGLRFRLHRGSRVNHREVASARSFVRRARERLQPLKVEGRP